MSARAREVLAAADVIACEDTRVTGKLLELVGIAARGLTPYHDHNAARARPILLERLRQGETVALVSDAGTPLVSDPGYRLVRACLDEGISVAAVPGPSAVLTALSVSGLPCDRFLFAGFPPNRRSARRSALAEVAEVPATLVFYESAQRLAASLADMAEILPGRDAAVARELTKLFEEVRRGPLSELARHYAEAGPPKGEIVIVVAPPPPPPPMESTELDALLRQALEGASVRDAAAAVAASTGLPRRQVYARALALADKDEPA
ncbi:MAG: 16S rRNA (cytidine(1402)-2'-O)-methyltransferase [Alphaproteobacteria bacterium]